MVLGLRLERHPVLAEVAIAAGLALRRVAAIDVLLGALGQADERELPVELGAVAPAQRGQGRRRGVGPRAARVGEVPDGDRLHKQHCGTWPPSARAAPPRRLTAVARARALAHRTRTRRCHVHRAAPPRCRPRRPRRCLWRARSVEHRARAPWSRSPPPASPREVRGCRWRAPTAKPRHLHRQRRVRQVASATGSPASCGSRRTQVRRGRRRGRRAGGGGGDDPDRARHQGRRGRGEGSEGGSGHDEHAPPPM